MQELGISNHEITLQKKSGTGTHYVCGNGTDNEGAQVGFYVGWTNSGRKAQIFNPAPEEFFKK